jgi:hypothetical protein
MSHLPTIYGSALIALGCWAAFTSYRTLTSRGAWRKYRAMAVVGAAFIASCFLPGVAFLAGRFEHWMIIPLGLCYLALMRFPCYFEWANHGRIRTWRNVLFLLVGVALVAAGFGLLPSSLFGL